MIDYSQVVKQKSDDELIQMVYAFKEWNPEMIQAVESELSNRKKLPNDILEKREILIQREDAKLLEGKKAGIFGKVIGFLTIFGLMGIMIGYHYAFSKVKGIYTDKEYFQYDDSSRKIGRILFYGGLVASSLFIILKILENDGVNI
jgi:hypothetical protein